MNLLEDIINLLHENYPGKKFDINLETKLSDIDYLDSLGLAIIAVALEDKYDFRFPNEYFEEIKNKTIAEVIVKIKQLLLKK